MITALYRLLEVLNLFARKHPAPRAEAAGRPATKTPGGVRRRPNSHLRATYLRAITGDAGMTTAEYAVGTVAAVAFAVVLFKVVQSPAVHSALAAVVTGALHVHM